MSKSSPEISIVIATLNGLKMLQDCLNSLKRFEKNYELVIVDNHSTDNTVSWVKKNYPQAIVIENNQNNGFAEANNQGIQASQGKYILFLNNDTIITESFLPVLVKALADTSVAAVQPLILFPDKHIDSVGSFFTYTGFLYHRAYRHLPDSKILKKEAVYSLKGACMLWKKEVLDQIGLLDDSFFAYFEETDLCHRAINAGYKLLVVPEVSITHLGGMTSAHIQSSFIQFNSYKNRIRTYIQNLPLGTLFILLPIHIPLCLGVALLFTLKNRGVGLAVLKGTLQGLYQGTIHRNFQKKRSLATLTRNPKLSYYKYLFTGLEAYDKVH